MLLHWVGEYLEGVLVVYGLMMWTVWDLKTVSKNVLMEELIIMTVTTYGTLESDATVSQIIVTMSGVRIKGITYDKYNHKS